MIPLSKGLGLSQSRVDVFSKDYNSETPVVSAPFDRHILGIPDFKLELFPFHSHLSYTLYVFSQCQTRVKLNRVFFPR